MSRGQRNRWIAALAVAAFTALLSGCGADAPTPRPSLVPSTITSRTVIPQPPVTRTVKVGVSELTAVRYAAWLESRQWCDQTRARGTKRHTDCSLLADRKFADVAYRDSARRAYLKRGTYTTYVIPRPAITSTSTSVVMVAKPPATKADTSRPVSLIAVVIGGLLAFGTPVLGIVAARAWLRRPRPSHAARAAAPPYVPPTYDHPQQTPETAHTAPEADDADTLIGKDGSWN